MTTIKFSALEADEFDALIDEKVWRELRKFLTLHPTDSHEIARLQGRIESLEEQRKSGDDPDARIRKYHKGFQKSS